LSVNFKGDYPRGIVTADAPHPIDVSSFSNTEGDYEL